MSINDPDAPGYSQKPRLRVIWNGVAIPGALAATVTSNNHFQADRFQVAFSLNQKITGIGSAAWWSAQSSLQLDIQIGFASANNSVPSWVSLIVGYVDKIGVSFERMIVQADGRDLTAFFIDNKNSGSYINQSPSDIIKSLAASRGISVQASSSPALTGRFWNGDHTSLSLNQGHKITTEWDLITDLASKSGYDVFMNGNTLYFQPATDPASDPYVWKYQFRNGVVYGNVWNLETNRVLTVSKGLRVVVKSWNSKQSRSFVRTSKVHGSGDGGAGINDYIVNRPNMTEEEAQAWADKHATELAVHELEISGRLFGDLILTPRVMVQLQGTGTSFDMTYFCVSVSKTVSNDGGFFMSASCKSAAPQNGEASAPRDVRAPITPPRKHRHNVPIIGNASGGQALA